LPNQQKPDIFQEVKEVFLGCLSNSTGHGLPQIVKPGNLFLNILWFIFYAVAVSVCGFLIYQAVDQYCQFDVITMTKIKRETKMKLPAITICSPHEKTSDMIIYCFQSSLKQCKIKNLEFYDRKGLPQYCVQLNNVTGLQSTEGSEYGYRLDLYKHEQARLYLAITDNSARVVLREVREYIFPGQETEYVLYKTVQTSLGLPYSNCNQSTDYRQVNCIEDCDKKATIEACGSGYDGKFQWSGLESGKCYNAFYNPSEIESKCNQECPVECNQVSFQSKRVDVELDIEDISIENYKKMISNKFDVSKYTDDEIKKRITRLSIFFDKFERTEITQSPSITTTSLIANVGGLLGKSFYSIGFKKKS
jgi:hypothetical protein